MKYDNLIYESGPVKFDDYISNKYNIVHTMLYQDALYNYFYQHIKELVMDKLMYSLFMCMHNCLTEYNDIEQMINIENKSQELFKIYNTDELNDIMNRQYILKLINYIDNSPYQEDIYSVLDMDSEDDRFNQISYLVVNIISLLYDLKNKIGNLVNNSNINDLVTNGSDDWTLSDFIIRYQNSLYIIGEDTNELTLFETELSNEEIFIYEDQFKSEYHIGFNKAGKFILDVDSNIDITSIYNELYYLVSYVNNILLSLFFDRLSRQYINTYKIIEKKGVEYFLPSKIIIYERKYPHHKKVVDLTPYWSNYQDRRYIDFSDIKIIDEKINDAQIEKINYINGTVKMYTKLNDFYYNTDTRYINGDTKINDDLIKDTFVNKIKNMYYK